MESIILLSSIHSHEPLEQIARIQLIDPVKDEFFHPIGFRNPRDSLLKQIYLLKIRQY